MHSLPPLVIDASSSVAGRGPDLAVDPLTGLYIRGALQQQLVAHFGRVDDDPSTTGLLLVDLDRFHLVNDSTGIATGDEVIRRVSARIHAVAPPGAFVARTSGDEFAVLLPDAEGAGRLATRLVELLARPLAVHGHVVTLTASVGIACGPADGAEPETLLRAAALAMHRAEQAGGHRAVAFEPWMMNHAAARHALETALRSALSLDHGAVRAGMGVEQFEVHYQPQVRLPDRAVEGFEALVRWRCPGRGLVAPNDFIPLAEETGLIGVLGDHVLNAACRTAAGWPVPPDSPPLQVAVNFSPLQLREGRALVAGIARALERSGLAPERLEIEITESALACDAHETLQAIKDLGVSLALDDFGAGYSSLGQLVRYPFDRLKIDRSFVSALTPGSGQGPSASGRRDAGAQAFAMIQSIVSIGAALGQQVIAEGVENELQAQLVLQAGAHHIQGYLISAPVPEWAVGALIGTLEEARARPASLPAPEAR